MVLLVAFVVLELGDALKQDCIVGALLPAGRMRLLDPADVLVPRLQRVRPIILLDTLFVCAKGRLSNYSNARQKNPLAYRWPSFNCSSEAVRTISSCSMFRPPLNGTIFSLVFSRSSIAGLFTKYQRKEKEIKLAINSSKQTAQIQIKNKTTTVINSSVAKLMEGGNCCQKQKIARRWR